MFGIQTVDFMLSLYDQYFIHSSACHLPCNEKYLCALKLQNALTVKLLLTFFVLDSATLASDRSTSSKIRDCREEEEEV